MMVEPVGGTGGDQNVAGDNQSEGGQGNSLVVLLVLCLPLDVIVGAIAVWFIL